MRFGKIKLASALIFSSAFTVSLVSGCSNTTTTDEAKFTIESKVNLSEGGSISVDKKEGKVGENVTVTIKTNEGYVLDDVLINSKSRESKEKTFSFKPEKGNTVIEAVFKKGAVEPYNLELTFDSTRGNVEADALTGTTDKDIKVTITPFKNYFVSSIIFNGNRVDSSKRTFAPIGGKNTLVVNFEKGEVNQKWTLKVESGTGGTVKVDKLQGNIGESANLTITCDNGYSVDSITLNNEIISKDATTIFPSSGENILKVSFVNLSEIKKLDYGFDMNYDFNIKNGTPLTTIEEIDNSIESARVNLGITVGEAEGTIKKFNFNNEKDYILRFFKKLGITKTESTNIFEAYLKAYILDEPVFEHETSSIEKFRKYNIFVNHLNVKEFCAIRFVELKLSSSTYENEDVSTYTFQNYSEFHRKDFLLEKYKGNSEIQNYLKTKFDGVDNQQPELSESKLTEIVESYKIESEFIYKIMKNFLKYVNNAKDYYEFDRINLDEFEDEEGAKKAQTKLQLIGKFLVESFASYNGFNKYFYNKTSIEIKQDLIECGLFYDSKIIFDLANYKKTNIKDVGDIYYTLKFYGNLLKDITYEEVLFLLRNNNSKSVASELELAKGCASLLQRASKYFADNPNEATTIKKHFAEGYKKIIKLTEISLFHHSTDNNATQNPFKYFVGVYYNDLSFFTSKINDLKSVDLATASKDYLGRFYYDLIKSTTPQKVEKPILYEESRYQNFNIGDKISLTFRYENSSGRKEISISQNDMKNFSTDKIGTRYGTFTTSDFFRGALRYSVKSQEEQFTYFNIEGNDGRDGVIAKGSDLTKIKITPRYDSQTSNLTYKDLIGLDVNKLGEQYASLKYKNDYYFIKVYVASSLDKNEIIEQKKIYAPVGLPIDIHRYISKNLTTKYKYPGLENKEFITYHGYNILEVDGKTDKTYITNEPGKKTFKVKYELSDTKEIGELNVEIEFKNVLKAKTTITRKYNNGHWSTNYSDYQFKDRVYDKNVKMLFDTNLVIQFDTGYDECTYYNGTETELSANDFNNKLNNTVLGKQVDTAVINGYDYVLEYQVYNVIDEYKDEFVLTTSGGESFYKGYTYNPDHSIVELRKMSAIVFDDKGKNSTYYIKQDTNYEFRSVASIDATTVGEHTATVKALDSTYKEVELSASYYVSEIQEDYLVDISLTLDKDAQYIGDEKFEVSYVYRILYNDYYTHKNRLVTYDQFNTATVTYNDIKAFINQPGKNVTVSYKGLNAHIANDIFVGKKLTGESGTTTFEAYENYCFTSKEDGTYLITFAEDVFLSNFYGFDYKVVNSKQLRVKVIAGDIVRLPNICKTTSATIEKVIV